MDENQNDIQESLEESIDTSNDIQEKTEESPDTSSEIKEKTEESPDTSSEIQEKTEKSSDTSSEIQERVEESLNTSSKIQEPKSKTKKSSKLKFPIILITICIIIAVLVTSLFFIIGNGNNNSKNLSLIFDKNKLIPVKENDLYGYISPQNGKMVINPQFKIANSFYGNFASVSYLENDSIRYGIIDKTGKIKLSTDSSYKIKNLSLYGLLIVDDVLYNKNFKALTDNFTKVKYENYGYLSYIKHDKDEKNIECGILNSKGKKTFSYKFKDSESSFSCSMGDNSEALNENYAVININNEKYAIINLENGKMIYDFTDKYISAFDDNIFKIYNKNSNLESVICIYKGKIAYETNSDVDISYYDYDKEILQIEDLSSDSNIYSYFDLSKKSNLNEKPEKSIQDTLKSLTGYSVFSENNKLGIMKNDNVILPCEYDDIDFLPLTTFNYLKNTKKAEYVIVKKGNNYLLINLKNSKVVENFNAFSISSYQTSTFIKGKLRDSNEYIVYNLLTGKYTRFDSSSTISVYSNYITVFKDGDLTYYNIDLNEIYKI